MALLLELSDQVQTAGHPGLEHRRGVQRDVRAGGGVGRGGEVIGVGLAFHLEDRDRDLGGQLGLGGEPLGIGPAVDHPLGLGVAGGQLEDVVVGVVDEQGAAEARCGRFSDGGVPVGEQLDEGADVVAADHRGQQLDRLDGLDQGAAGFALGHGTQPVGLDVGRFIHARGDALGEEMQQKLFFTGGRCLEEFSQGLGFSGCQRQGGDPLGFSLRSGGAVVGKEAAGRHRRWNPGGSRSVDV